MKHRPGIGANVQIDPDPTDHPRAGSMSRDLDMVSRTKSNARMKSLKILTPKLSCKVESRRHRSI